LTSIHWRPLVLLRYGTIDTPAELARQINVDSGAMTRTLDRLETKGFLTRRRSQADRRVVKLELTATGNDVVASILPAVAGSLNAHLDGFTQSELDQLLNFLRRLIENGSENGRPVNDVATGAQADQGER
jgi:DNA-binding MarR family transcriptional regulator